MLKHLTNADFDAEINSKEPVLVDFWAPWCGPCRMIGPVIEELAEEYAGKAKICKVNVDEEPELARRFKIVSIPCVIVFKEGDDAERLVGARGREDYEKALGLA
jgi:thioredoxin 1